MNKQLTWVLAISVACVTTLSARAQEVQGNAKAGADKVAMCIGCHGIVGYKASFPEVYRVPMISGQNAKYIVAALNAYKKDERRNPTMKGIAYSLSEQDMADVAAYYEQSGKLDAASATKPAVEPGAKVAELLKKGACVSCHGDNLSKPIDPSYPRIAGQNTDYLYVALKSYKDDSHTTWGRSNAVMGGIAKQFSLGELKLLASHVGAMPTELKVVPQTNFR